MTKTVFDNAMTAHVWAQQQQPDGKSSNGNFWFEADTIKSYATTMAKFVTIGGERCVLINAETYSVSTSRHQSYILQALCGGLRQVYSYGSRSAESIDCMDYVTMCRELVAQAIQATAKAGRARSNKGFYQDQAAKHLAMANELATLARIKGKVKITKDLQKATKLYAEKLAKQRKQRANGLVEEKERTQLADLELFTEWQAGTRSQCPLSYREDAHGSVFMRVMRTGVRDPNGEACDELQTSKGARVPLRQAIRVFRLVKWCKENGKTWKPNGLRLKAGPFAIEWIKPDGSMRAMCHYFTWERICEVAEIAGALDIPPISPEIAAQGEEWGHG